MEAYQISKHNYKQGTMNEQMQGSKDITVFPTIFNVFIKNLEGKNPPSLTLQKVQRLREE